MTTYRFTIYTDSVRESRLGRADAHGTMTHKRDSKKARATALAVFETQLQNNVPDGRNARAWLEVSDSHGYTTTLAAHVGRSTVTADIKSARYGAAIGGVWTLDKWHPSTESALKDFVNAGMKAL